MPTPPNATETLPVTIQIPREAMTLIAPPPDLLHQKNCQAVTGLTVRTYLEMLKEPGAPDVAHVGKLRVVRREEFLAFVMSHRGPANDVRRPLAKTVADQELDELAAELGLVRVAPRST